MTIEINTYDAQLATLTETVNELVTNGSGSKTLIEQGESVTFYQASTGGNGDGLSTTTAFTSLGTALSRIATNYWIDGEATLYLNPQDVHSLNSIAATFHDSSQVEQGTDQNLNLIANNVFPEVQGSGILTLDFQDSTLGLDAYINYKIIADSSAVKIVLKNLNVVQNELEHEGIALNVSGFNFLELDKVTFFTQKVSFNCENLLLKEVKVKGIFYDYSDTTAIDLLDLSETSSYLSYGTNHIINKGAEIKIQNEYSFNTRYQLTGGYIDYLGNSSFISYGSGSNQNLNHDEDSFIASFIHKIIKGFVNQISTVNFDVYQQIAFIDCKNLTFYSFQSHFSNYIPYVHDINVDSEDGGFKDYQDPAEVLGVTTKQKAINKIAHTYDSYTKHTQGGITSFQGNSIYYNEINYIEYNFAETYPKTRHLGFSSRIILSATDLSKDLLYVIVRDGIVQLTEEFATEDNLRNTIYLGAVYISNGAITGYQSILIDEHPRYQNLVFNGGFKNTKVKVLGIVNTKNLTLPAAAMDVVGINYFNDPNKPNTLELDEVPVLSWDLLTPDNQVLAANQTELDFSDYFNDSGNVIETNRDAAATARFLYYCPYRSGNKWVQVIGTRQYNSLTVAKERWESETDHELPDFLGPCKLIAVILGRKNFTNAANKGHVNIKPILDNKLF